LIKKKRIFVAVTNDISTDQRVHKTASYLIAKNFDVLVYGRVLSNTFKVERSYQIIRKKLWFNHHFLFYAEYNFKLFFKLLFYKCDYILANDLDTLPACFAASRFKKAELVYDSHELFSEGPELQGRNFVKGFWRNLEKFLLPKIKKTYTVSNSIADFYNAKYKINMGVVRNIPLLEKKGIKVNVKFPTANKTVLYQGVLNPGRGIKPMIKALHLLKNVDLIIIGYGKVEKELQLFVKDQLLENRVHFLGRVPHDELFNYTKLADIGMVLEEPLGLSFEYSLPNKLFDYIHAELPIISSNLIEISSIIKKHKVGVVVEDYNPKTIASTIQNLLEDKELYQEIKINQQNVKNEFCWENEKQLLDTYFN
jgi:glycosyltransferase involved in cell wall biosynthesis